MRLRALSVIVRAIVVIYEASVNALFASNACLQARCTTNPLQLHPFAQRRVVFIVSQLVSFSLVCLRVRLARTLPKLWALYILLHEPRELGVGVPPLLPSGEAPFALLRRAALAPLPPIPKHFSRC
jgi:hypothetical protein